MESCKIDFLRRLVGLWELINLRLRKFRGDFQNCKSTTVFDYKDRFFTLYEQVEKKKNHCVVLGEVSCVMNWTEIRMW